MVINQLLKTYNSDFDHIPITFTDQNSKPLEIEDRRESLFDTTN